MLSNNGLVKDFKEFDNHRLVLCLHDEVSGLHGYIAIHRGGLKKPAFGATRVWKYSSDKAALRDVLTLSKIMTYKSALAGCGYGGGKAVLFFPAESKNKIQMLQSYARMVNFLEGHFRTGADVGVTDVEVRQMRRFSRYFVGVKYDPVKYTLVGLIAAVKTCLTEVFGSDNFSGRTFAIQGLGKTGLGLVEQLYPYAKKIYVCDVDKNKCRQVKKSFPKIFPTDVDNIFRVKADVFSPCALGNVLNFQSIKHLRAAIVCGSANCQLGDETSGETIHKSGILYAPDYIVNAGGLISVIDEYEHDIASNKRVSNKVIKIGNTLRKIIDIAKLRHLSTSCVADKLAVKISRQFS